MVILAGALTACGAGMTDIGYDGYTCIEVEDKAFEGSLEDAKKAVQLSIRYLRNFVI